MRSLSASLLAVLFFGLVGCADNSNQSAYRPGTEPPPIRSAGDTGLVVYPDPPMEDAPDLVEVDGKADGPLRPAPEKRCHVMDFDYEVKPKKVERQIITFVKQEVDFERTVDVDPRMMEAEHLHLVSITLEVESGSTLDFMDWLLIYVVPPSGSPVDVAWGADFTQDWTAELKVDGQRDLRGLLRDSGEVKLQALTYAKSPDEDTMLGATLTFRSFYDCVWE